MFDKLGLKLKYGLNIFAILTVTLFFAVFFLSYYHMLSQDYQKRAEMIGQRSVQNVRTNLRSIEEGMNMFMYRYDLSKIETDIPDELSANFFFNFIIYCPCNIAFVTMKDSDYFFPDNEKREYGTFIGDYGIDEILAEKDSCWTYYDSPYGRDMVFLTKPIKDKTGKTVGFLSAGIQGLSSVMEHNTSRKIFVDSLYFGFGNDELRSIDGKRTDNELLKKAVAEKRSYSDKKVSITYSEAGNEGIVVLSYCEKKYMNQLFLKLLAVLVPAYGMMIFLHMMFVRRLIHWITEKLTELCGSIDEYGKELNGKHI